MKNRTAHIAALAGAITFAVTLVATGGLPEKEAQAPAQSPTIEIETAAPVKIPNI